MGHESRARAARQRKKQGEGAIWHYGFYFVVYVDLLGQREELMKLTALPPSEAEKGRVLKALRASAGQVQVIRESFNSYLKAVTNSRTGRYERLLTYFAANGFPNPSEA
jgi:hypothetical protein